jgi:anti-sigma factor RsiW
MFSCRDLSRHASGYLDHDLPQWTRLRVSLHLLICRNCRHYLGQIRQTLALLAATFPADLTDDTKNRLLQAYRRAANKQIQQGK